MNDVSLMGVKLCSVPLGGDENGEGGAQRRQGRLLQRCESIRRANASKGVSGEDESPPTLIPSWGEKLLWRAGVQISTAGLPMLRYADVNSKTHICCSTLPLPGMEKSIPLIKEATP